MTNGKGDKWRKTDYYKYFLNFPDDMGPKPKEDDFHICSICGKQVIGKICDCCDLSQKTVKKVLDNLAS